MLNILAPPNTWAGYATGRAATRTCGRLTAQILYYSIWRNSVHDGSGQLWQCMWHTV